MAIDVDQESFQREVLDRSRSLPVVVDFWAEWCGPCHALGPVLDRAASARAGKVILAKLDVDANSGLASEYGIQGIPAVKAFRDGKVASEFVGAIPPAEVERFFDSLVPSEADALVGSGDEASLRRALELEPGRADAALRLASLLHDRGEGDQALDVLEGVEGSFEADGLAARIRLERAGGEPREALAMLAREEIEPALERLIDAVENAEDGMREELRKVIVGVLAELGPEDPRAREYRRRLAAALY
jgi:putative thioredoxin